MIEMIRIRKVMWFALLVIILFLIFVCYSLIILTNSEIEVISALSTEEKILLKLSSLPEIYHRYNEVDNLTKLFFHNLKISKSQKNHSDLWREANADISANKLYDINNKNLGDILNALKTAKIIKADLDTRGTQLKLLLTLGGNQQVVFKPKWYDKNKLITGPIYAGKDRYNSEIVGFYLSGILNKPLAPLSVQRTINFKTEILPFATPLLLSTYFQIRNNISCVYGVCLYCKKTDPICEDLNGNLEGVVIFDVHQPFTTHRSPWQRTYKTSKLATWQANENYCKTIKVSKTRLYDLIDTAIFDFLIQNGDRHHYETLNDRVVLIDNGKGLGNPYVNHIDILAPLYQCCILREATWSRLVMLSGSLLKKILLTVPNITDIVSEIHIDSIDKRLLTVFATVEYCKTK